MRLLYESHRMAQLGHEKGANNSHHSLMIGVFYYIILIKNKTHLYNSQSVFPFGSVEPYFLLFTKHKFPCILQFFTKFQNLRLIYVIHILTHYPTYLNTLFTSVYHFVYICIFITQTFFPSP